MMFKFLLAAAMLQCAFGVVCNRDGSSYSYTESISSDGKTRTVVTNFCPNHPYFNNNPNTANSQSTTLTMPAKPKLVGTGVTKSPAVSATASKSLAAQGGTVGVIFSGGQLYSPYGVALTLPLP